MVNALRHILKKLNRSLTLSALGLILAVFAIWFDGLGFIIDRGEARDTTDSLIRVEKYLSPREAIYITNVVDEGTSVQQFLQPEYTVPTGVGSHPGERTCDITWSAPNGAKYLARIDEQSLVYLEIFDPTVMHIVNYVWLEGVQAEEAEEFYEIFQEEEEYKLWLDGKETPFKVIINFLDCEMVERRYLSYDNCIDLRLYDIDWAILRAVELVEIKPSGKWAKEYLDSRKDVYRSLVAALEKRLRAVDAEDRKKFDLDFQRLKSVKRSRSDDQEQSYAYVDDYGRRVVRYGSSRRPKLHIENDPLPERMWRPTRNEPLLSIKLDIEKLENAIELHRDCLSKEWNPNEHLIVRK